MKSGFTAIIGRPNVGKSTLLNRFVGEELAIVTPKAQTTRNKIIGICNKEGAQVVFLDTPGFHEAKKAINKLMVEKIGEAITSADVVLLMVEPSREGADPMDMELFKKCRAGGKAVIIVINKIDTVIGEPWGSMVERYYEAFEKTPTAAISASRGDGCDVLLRKLIELLPTGEPFYPDDRYTEHPERFLASEMVREQAMLLLHDEIPYAIAVQVESFKEGDKLTKISASIIVEKESQKGIVIGAGGRMIKEIGQRARQKIERMLNTKVFLELFVKVEKDWTKNITTLE